MGREQELLESARSGNVSIIEKILTPRKKMTVGSLPLSLGPFQSLRRAPNPNCHDQNGDTPLHLAALNGHIEVVKKLLSHEASTNVMDFKGCCPLHLAAWSGNAEMCKVLLTHGPSIAMINEQNQSGETALHCAAQYGHTEVVAVLLQHQADAFVRNNVTESALDLASQYGRLDTVELLVRKHPALLTDHTGNQSPLHLASRNGHRHVVQVLLDSGYNIDKSTEGGSALHEAAIFGKQDVVRLLLKRGIDITLTDGGSRTALEVLSEHKSQLSLDIGRIILDYQEGRSISEKRSSGQSTSSDLLEEPLYDLPATGRRFYQSETDSLTDRRTHSARSSTDSSIFGGASGGARFSTCSESYFVYDTPRSRPIPIGLEEVDSASDTSDTAHSLPGATSLSYSSGSYIPQCNIGAPLSRSSQGTSLPVTPETPKKPPRRKPPGSVKCSGGRVSPPKMVFINKRSSTTSRDSGSDTDKMKETNGNSGNNNICVSSAYTDTCDNTTNVNLQRNTLRDSAHVTNSNLQQQTLISTQTQQRNSQKRQSTIENNNVTESDTKTETPAVDNGDFLRGSTDGSTVVYRSSVLIVM